MMTSRVETCARQITIKFPEVGHNLLGHVARSFTAMRSPCYAWVYVTNGVEHSGCNQYNRESHETHCLQILDIDEN